MTQMIVRPPQFWVNPFGDLAENYKIYVGKSNQDPTQGISQLQVTDGKNGAIVQQPILVTNGITRNADGQQILPVINAQQYSIYYEANNGVERYSEAEFFGDGLEAAGGGGGGSIAENVFNNLDQALAEDLTGINYIFIQSTASGWEGTDSGPAINSLYYYSGGTGSPSTGDDQVFYDAIGNEWKLAKSVAGQVNEAGIATNTQAIADNAAEIATNAADIATNTANISANAAAISDLSASFAGGVVNSIGSALFISTGSSVQRQSLGSYRVDLPGAGWALTVTVASNVFETRNLTVRADPNSTASFYEVYILLDGSTLVDAPFNFTAVKLS
jgi:hypothetical protein